MLRGRIGISVDPASEVGWFCCRDGAGLGKEVAGWTRNCCCSSEFELSSCLIAMPSEEKEVLDCGQSAGLECWTPPCWAESNGDNV